MKPWKKSEKEIARKVTQQRGLLRRDRAPGEDYCMPAANLADLFKGEQPEKKRWFGDQDYVIVDSGPVPLQFKLNVNTKDDHKLEGDLTLTYVLNTELAANKLTHTVINMFAIEGKSEILRSDLENILSPKLSETAIGVAGTFTAEDICFNKRGDVYVRLKSELQLAKYGLEASELVCKWSGRFLDFLEQRAIIELEASLKSVEAESAYKDLQSQFELLKIKRNITETRANMQESLLAIERARVENLFEQKKAEQHLELEKEKEESELHLHQRREEQELYLAKIREEQRLNLEIAERESVARVAEYKVRMESLEQELKIKDKELLLREKEKEIRSVVALDNNNTSQVLNDLVLVLNKLLDSQGIKKIKAPDISEIEKKVGSYERAAGPLLPEIYFRLGNAAYSNGKLQTALNWYGKLTNMSPKNEFGWNNMGAVLYQLGRGNEALSCYERALSIRKTFPEALNNKAIFLYKNGELESAKALLYEAISIGNGKNQIAYNLAVVEFKLGRPSDAKGRLEKIIAAEGANQIVRVALGDICVSEKDFSGADMHYAKALEFSPGNKTIWLRRFAAFVSANDMEGADYCITILTRPAAGKLARHVLRGKNG